MECSKNLIPQIKAAKMKPLILNNLTFMPVTDSTLTLSDFEKARKDLGETEEKKEISLSILKEILRKDKIKYRMDDDYLLRYLRFGKFKCDRASSSIKNLYLSRKKYPNIFRIPPNLEYILNSGILTCLPYADEEKNSIFIIKCEKWNPDEIPFLEFLSFVFIMWDIMTMNPHSQINGSMSIYDTKGCSVYQVTKILRHMMSISPLLQDIYPWRVTKLIGFNFNTISRNLFKFISPLLKKKIHDKVKIIGSDFHELHQHINPAILPKEYGGNLENNSFSFSQFVLDNLMYVKYEHSFGFPLED